MIFKPTKLTSRGFTLLELAVTITIFVLLTTAVLIKNSRFRNDMLITNLAYEIALTVREAQVYGINVVAVDPNIFNPDYTKAHGVHFVQGGSSFDFFVDLDNNELYDSDDGDPENTFTLREGAQVFMLCSVNQSNTVNCNVETLDISYKRPDPEARIHADSDGDRLKTGVICIKSPQDVVRKIEVKSTGQISVLTNSALYSDCDS